MPIWLKQLITLYGTLAPILGGLYYLGDKSGWRPEWHWEAQQRAWYDKAGFLLYRIKENRADGKPDDPRIVGIYCGLTQAIAIPPDSTVNCW